MPKFFVSDLNSPVRVEGENFKHIAKSLRMKANEEIALCDGCGNDGYGVITFVGEDYLTVEIKEVKKCEGEPKTNVALYAAWPKGDKPDLIVQKAVEMGASSITFVMSEFCVSKPKDADKKITRLQKIAFEAACQSRRGIIPPVKGIISLKEAVNEMKKTEKPFMLYEGECDSLRSHLKEGISSISLISGPEGGFSKSEVSYCLNEGVIPVSLGKRILRCETAPLATLSALLFYMGDMD